MIYKRESLLHKRFVEDTKLSLDELQEEIIRRNVHALIDGIPIDKLKSLFNVIILDPQSEESQKLLKAYLHDDSVKWEIKELEREELIKYKASIYLK